MDLRLKVPAGTSFKKSGVATRYFMQDESIAIMAARAVEGALSNAGLRFEELDALIFAAASPQQPIPCTAAFVQKELGYGCSGVACFDIDATCLSFIVAMDYAMLAIGAGRFRRVAVVSAESARDHLNYEHLESASLFGDGAVAFIFAHNDIPQGVQLIKSHMETYGDYTNLCELKGGGVSLPPSHYDAKRHAEFCFTMNGPKLFKTTRKYLSRFIDRLFENTNYQISDVDVLVPHQASRTAMELFKRHVGVASERWVDILEDYGNQVSVSIPTAFHYALETGRIQSGDLVLLIGTGAGLAFAGHLLKF